MADTDSDVDMSPPTTPTRASSVPFPLSSTPTNRSRTTRFTNSSEVLYNPEDPFTSPVKGPSNKPKGNITKFTEDVFDELRDAMIGREQIAEEFSKALDEATSRVQKLGLEHAMGHLERALALVIKRFAHGDVPLNDESKHAGLSESIYTKRQGQPSSSKPSYAEAIKTYLPKTTKPYLPPKPCKSLPNYTSRTRKIDNRIFVRLPENHPSRAHHVHAVKAALVNKLGPEGAIVKTIQKFKSGLAIVPADGKQAEQILNNSQVNTSVLGGQVEKAEEWFTYVIDHVLRKIHSLDGTEFEITEESAKKEVKAATAQIPVRISWPRKTLENPAPTGTIVASFKNHTHAFRLFGTSFMARRIIKSPKPTQCPKCWGFHNARLCNYEQRCKQCSTLGHSFCQKPPRCTNCKGPQAADEKHCPARPKLNRGVIVNHTQAELKRIRKVGHQSWLLANPANVARGQTNHDLALVLASAELADVILLQEPWILPDRGKKITKQHPDYDIFSPADTWDTRPRVLTYTRKGRNLQASQNRPSETADIRWVSIIGVTPPITIVNVYRPPQESEGGTVITAIKAWRPSPNCLIAGDFNTRHLLWDSRASASRKAEELVDWAQTNSLLLISPTDKSTHTRGSTLDLVFTNNPHIQCNIEEHLYTTSDHETLLTLVPCAGLKPPPTRVKFKLTPEAIPHFATGVKETLPPSNLLPHDPEILANKIIQSIQVNMQRFLPQKRQITQGTKRWNKECAEKSATFRRARRLGDATAEKKELRKATRAAKRALWMKQVQNANSPKDIYKITGWYKFNGAYANPPIKHDGFIYTDATSKASALRRALLERRSADEDVSQQLDPIGYQAKLQVQDTVEMTEVEHSILNSANTAPGIDGISTEI